MEVDGANRRTEDCMQYAGPEKRTAKSSACLSGDKNPFIYIYS